MLTAKISAKTKAELKALAALNKQSLQSYLEQIIREHCDSEAKKQGLNLGDSTPPEGDRENWRNLLKN